MDKELAQLEEWAVDLINNYEKELLITDPKSSQHKRIKRFSGELVANPEAYGELLEMGRSQGMTGKELVSAIRQIEQNLLDESSRGTSMSRKQLMSDVIHHFYAQRTGGDTLRRLGQADRQQARAALRDIFGRWGNVPENLKSMFRAGHLDSDILKGVEGEAAAELGIKQAKELDLPKAHTTKGGLVTGTGKGITDWRGAVDFMAPQMDIQRTEGLKAIRGLQPLMDKLNAIAGNNYTGLENAPELKIRRDLLTAKADDVRAAIREFYEPLVIKGGKINFNATLLPWADQAVETVTKNPVGAALGAATFIEPEAVKAALQGDYIEAGKQTVAGAGLGALVEQGIKKAAPVVTQTASKVLPKAAMSFVGGAVKFVPVLAGGMAGYQMLDAIVEGATGRNLQETGVAAEETKQQLREEGYSEYDLRRRARTGYRKP